MPDALPTLDFLTRRDCHLCEDARAELQRVLEARVVSGRFTPTVRYLDVDLEPELQHRYTNLVPVLRFGEAELPLAMRPGAIRHFLDERLDARVA